MKLQEALIKLLVISLVLTTLPITLKASPLPTASFTIPATAFVGEPVIADGSASTGVNGQVGWSTKTFADGRSPVSWNFGDNLGTYSTPRILKQIHIYFTAGTYTVSLTVKDSSGNPDTISQSITILDIPAATGLNIRTAVEQGNPSANRTHVQSLWTTAAAANTVEQEILIPNTMQITGVLTAPTSYAGNKYITIRPVSTSFLPSQTNRISPSNSVNMPKISSPGVDQTQLVIPANAKYLRLLGIEFNKQAGHLYQFATIGSGATTYAQLPNHIIIDRCYFKGNAFDDTDRAIFINADSFSIINSYISDMHDTGSDAQALAGFAGAGIGIVNNYLNGLGENILFGGANGGINFQTTASSTTSTTATLASVSNLRVGDGISFLLGGNRGPWSATIVRSISGNNITFDQVTNASGVATAPDTAANGVKYGSSPQDILVARNYLFKSLTYRVGDPSFNGVYTAVVKNSFELKHAMRVTVDGNIIENHWGGQGQAGPTVLLSPRNQTCYLLVFPHDPVTCPEQVNPWTMVRDVQLTNNKVKNIADFINIIGSDNLNPVGTGDESGPSAYIRYILVDNNLIERVDPTGLNGSNGDLIFIWPGAKTVTVNHNTQINISGNRIVGTSANGINGNTADNVLILNNIFKHLTYGLLGDGFAANTFVTTFMPDGFVTNNVISDDESSIGPNGESWIVPRTMPNYFPATINTNTFIDLAGGNYRLKSTSPYKAGGATPAADGLDIGVNFDTVLSSTASVVTGNWSAPSSILKCNWHTLNICN